MAPAMQSAEIQFAQRLASSEKGVRDRAVKKLRQYLSVKTQRETGGFSQEELLKIWKGLFYCMWVQDEPLVQEELVNTVSQLIHVVNNSEAQHLFIQTFWQTMNREWKGIDKLHLDKYYMLIRMVLRQSFEVLKRNGWEESRIKLFLDVLMKEVLCPESQSPDGVRFHFIDIYLDELSTVGGKELLADQNLKFIDPFCKVAAKTKDHTLVQTIARGVFEVIVKQSPFTPEETGEDQETQCNGKDSSGKVFPTNETTWKKTGGRSKTAPDKGIPKREGEDSTTPEDPSPPLQFDYKAVADRLLEITNRKNTPPFNRKHLCKLIKKFQELSEAGNVAQLSFAEDIAGEGDQALSQGKRKKKRKKLLEKANLEQEKGRQVFLVEEEDNEGSTQKRRRKKKKRSHFQPETQGLEDAAAPLAQSMDSQAGATKKQTPQTCEDEPESETVSLTQSESSSEHPRTVPTGSKRTRPKKKSLQAQRGALEPTESPVEGTSQGPERGPSCELPQGPAAQGPLTNGARVLKRKRKLGALPVNGAGLPSMSWPSTKTSPGEGEDGRVTLPHFKKLQKKRAEPSSLVHQTLSSQKTAVSKKRKKIKEMSNLLEHNGMMESKVKQIQVLGSSRALSPLKKPLRTENDFVKFEVSCLPKPLFYRKAKSGAATWSPDPAIEEHTPQHALPGLNKTPTSSKKVTFGLNRNMTTEFKKTDKSILVSPTGLARVAFDPEQRPIHGVLKTPTSSPTITPLVTKMPLAATPKRRPRAADFF